ncbi:MAG TPA: MFS transporter [Rhodopila sp.]|uniref:MFS transporter n=1 Tax=Rhodopila sp. TaxID=2480087 RepID=UPI002C533366|nr:MFS transporter [Rhodopila sp.]HVY16519.1 MFS transporter [Rhodopila sp.]
MRSRLGLNGLNFLTAAIQAGFGPFIAVWLTQNGWSLESIGFALSLGTFAQVIAQVPGGWLVDHIHLKRYATGGALIGLGVAALMLVTTPSHATVWGSQILHAVASAVMTPALAALTLKLCGHGSFGNRLGVNARYASLGAAGSAALLGAAASVTSDRSVFLLTAVLVIPALCTLLLIRPSDMVEAEEQDHSALLHPTERERPAWCIFRIPALHVFAVAAVLFQLANAGLLPAALNILTRRGEGQGFVVSACIILPQMVVAALSPWAGTLAERIGRRPILLIGFAAVPLRALLFATLPGAVPVIVIETLDGVSATVFGMMLPLIAADVTKDNGYLNLAIGSLGLAASLGATFSPTLAGVVANHFGDPAAFLCLGTAGLAGVVVLAFAMPETRPERSRDVSEATLAA